MENNKKQEVSILEKKRSWFELALAAVFYGVFIYLLGILIYVLYLGASFVLFIKLLTSVVSVGGFCLGYGLLFSATKDIIINVTDSIIITRYVVGPFSYDVNSKVTEFEYVSFFVDKWGEYATNLWYVKNRHYKMCSFETKQMAYQFCLDLSNKLDIDILDATEKGNFKWIEKDNFKIN
ncbi:hypothetical protein [Flavobacterium geliluteum]|uniref:Uncharacterized protein n=1 Tax=Flavobacterium geliluteum TaxID=2816120 RepID=A0A940X9Y5_9FLAO|nr:hypothetical protein [Flavobacterium geliluteum]MBP4138036.1 hypothetical protein [Flavobacterium geliluteum]